VEVAPLVRLKLVYNTKKYVAENRCCLFLKRKYVTGRIVLIAFKTTAAQL